MKRSLGTALSGLRSILTSRDVASKARVSTATRVLASLDGMADAVRNRVAPNGTAPTLHDEGNWTLMGASLSLPPTPPTAIGISTQVQDTTAYTGGEASFAFVATNDTAPSIASTYQWYRNSQIVTGATGPQFTFLAGPTDANAEVYCVAVMSSSYVPTTRAICS